MSYEKLHLEKVSSQQPIIAGFNFVSDQIKTQSALEDTNTRQSDILHVTSHEHSQESISKELIQQIRIDYLDYLRLFSKIKKVDNEQSVIMSVQSFAQERSKKYSLYEIAEALADNQGFVLKMDNMQSTNFKSLGQKLEVPKKEFHLEAVKFKIQNYGTGTGSFRVLTFDTLVTGKNSNEVTLGVSGYHLPIPRSRE